jgi:hypothetical protein
LGWTRTAVAVVACHSDQKQRCAGNAPQPPILAQFLRAAIEQHTASKQRVRGHQQKADSIDPGPRSELVDQPVIHLRVAKLVPGHTGDAGSCQFQGCPENRRGGQRQARAARGAAHQYNAQAEEAKVKPQHQAEREQ